MKRIVTGLCLILLSGCITADRMVDAGSDPRKGERYKIYLRTLKVVQVCDDCVHVKHETDEGLRICVVPVVNDYVTGSYLRSGLYVYAGPYTYETVKDLAGNKNRNTVRLFIEKKESE